MNRISVIIPAHNRECLLPFTLASLLRQSRPASEIIVVDDGSSDRTAEVAESFGPPVRVLRQANAGPAAARNRGFAESTGEYIHFFDSDDLALPNKHEVQARALDDTGADIAYSPWIKGVITSVAFKSEGLVLQQHGLPRGDLARALLTHWSIVPHACLFRRSIIEACGGFPEDLRVAEDQLMFLRCLLAGARVVHAPGTLELYRTNGSDKLTAESESARERHRLGWASFLCQARSECLRHGVDPAAWFAFRLRAWDAEIHLGPAADPALRQGLRSIAGAGPGAALYAPARAVRRKLEGLRGRWRGCRSHPCFRSGPMTPSQQTGVKRTLTQTDAPLPPAHPSPWSA